MKLPEKKNIETAMTWYKGFSEEYGLPANFFKIMACMFMFVDHWAAIVLPVYDSFNFDITYGFLRTVGRLAWPIFAFFLVEGFFHTRDRKKYFYRLVIFALVSVIPCNLAFEGDFLCLSMSNIGFDLVLGFLFMTYMECFKTWDVMSSQKKQVAFSVCSLILFSALGFLLGLSYSCFGVITIGVLYLTYRYKPFNLVAGGLTFFYEPVAILSFGGLFFYSGQRGEYDLKRFFYLFYPVHLLVLWIVKIVLV